ncbi:MAG: (2Fe-2S)-binding protein [Candidatus Methylomirabilis sp.]|nr:(2Fe-2S)-binding protein [Deltaproteobacteria bacterium]
MAKITVHNPGDTQVWECDDPNLSVLDVALDRGFPMEHECCGAARCSTCRIHVESGAEHLSDMEEDELDMLDKEGLEDPYRLGCQTRLKMTGDVVITIEKLDPHAH